MVVVFVIVVESELIFFVSVSVHLSQSVYINHEAKTTQWFHPLDPSAPLAIKK
jgi:hypothetical protein